MKRSVKLWQLMGFAITSLLGTILHFIYEWSEQAAWIAPFSGVNESTWEHMKLIFWPMFMFAAVQSFFFQYRKDFWCVKLCGILLGLTSIPILFYAYNGVIGKSPDWLNIAIFFISAFAAYVYEARQFNTEQTECRHPKSAFAVLCLIALCFFIFTFATPEIEIFRDPITNSYGIKS